MSDIFSYFQDGHWLQGTFIYLNSITMGYFVVIAALAVYVCMYITNKNLTAIGILNTGLLTLFGASYLTGSVIIPVESLYSMLLLEVLLLGSIVMNVVYKKMEGA